MSTQKTACALAAATFVIAVSNAFCMETRRFTGEVISIAPRTITVKRGDEEIQFTKSPDLRSVRRGERVTVIYSLDAQRVQPATQAAGEAAGEAAPAPTGNAIPEQKLILDDRAFLNAGNIIAPKEKKSG